MAERPVPRPTTDSAAFWSAVAEGRLLGQRCAECGVWRWPPKEHCPSCHAAAPEWSELAGTGTIAGMVVMHRPFAPWTAEHLPLAIIQVRLDGTDDVMVLTSNLVGDVSDATVGARVAVRFEQLPEGALPVFALHRD